MIWIFLIVICTLPFGIVCASFFEWGLHRFIMHKPVPGFRYPYEKHHLVHHQVFGADESFHVSNEPDKGTIRMAWWNGPVLVFLGTVISGTMAFWIVNSLLPTWGERIAMWSTLLVGFATYFTMYEYFHWCMHNPKGRWFESTRFYEFMKMHHLIHHFRMDRNFNVVLPIADWFLRTLLLYKEIRRKHARRLCRIRIFEGLNNRFFPVLKKA